MRRRHTAAAGGSLESGQRGHTSINLASFLPDRLAAAASPRRPSPSSPRSTTSKTSSMNSWRRSRSYRDRMWLISDGSTDNTVMRLRQAGWRCFDDGINRRKPGAIRRLLERLPPHIETVMVIDPDIRIRGRQRRQRDRSGAVRQRLPAVRCRRGVSAHHDRAGRLSGALPGVRVRARFPASDARVSRTSASPRAGFRSIGAARWTRALSEHSLSVYAEDLENAMILLAAGERIYYDGRLVVSTEGPGSLQRWFSQRVGLVSRPAQGLQRALLRRSCGSAAARRSRSITTSLCRRPVARHASGEDRERSAAAAEPAQRPRCAARSTI